jgi:hypothetical protein
MAAVASFGSSPVLVQRAPAVLWREAEFGVVLLAPGAREPMTLTGTGRALWHALAAPTTPLALAADLAAAFDTDLARVDADITPVLDELHELGVIETVPG